jgi:hypothetical protein
MGVRAYLAFVLAVMLGITFWIGEQFEWWGRGKARAAKAVQGGTLYTLKLRPSYIVDLESGTFSSDGGLRWGMQNRNERPKLSAYNGAMIALAGDKPWEDIDAAYLAALPYAATSYFFGDDAPLRRGTVFAMRTARGSLAKLRIVTLWQGWELETQWVVYPATPHSEPTPWAEAMRRREQALAAYRARDYASVIRECHAGIAAAARAGEGGPVHAQALIQCGSFLELARYAPAEAEAWLQRGVSLAEALGTERITATLGPLEVELHKRGLHSLAVLQGKR